MNTLTGKPQLLKQANLSLIRRTILEKGTATRAEISKETQISSTTVRSLLTELMQEGEIESIGYDESSGGRKAERYRFNPERYYSAAFCIGAGKIHALLINICGKIVDFVLLESSENQYEEVIIGFLDELIKEKEIKSIGIGVPGAVEKGCYWKKDMETGELYRTNIGERLAERYGIPVVLENDINAIAIGFGRCYQKSYPEDKPEDTNMAYLHFEKGCVSAGFIAGGRILRGSRNFAGELGLIPMENGKPLDEYMEQIEGDISYTDVITRIICWVCGILNPQYIVLGGSDLRKSCIGPISDEVYALLPEYMSAQILYSDEMWNDYQEGMAYLAAGKMFDEIQVVKGE